MSFAGFANVWVAVALSRSLRRDPMSISVAGVPVALFRDGTGAARGLVDQCPHRGVKLSLGQVKDGCLSCPFHGWRFDGDGACVEVPWNPDAKLAQLSATPVPVLERGGMIWLYTAFGQEAPTEPIVPQLLLRDDVTISGERIRWRTHWTRAMENMLDSPHLPFVHAKTIGRFVPPGKRMDIAWQETPFGGTVRTSIDGVPQSGGLDYHFPNAMFLHISDAPRIFAQFVSVIPVDDENTDMVLTTVRSFLRPHLFDAVFARSNRRIAGEDRAIVESSSPSSVPHPSEEASVRTDQPTLAFRRRYFAELAASSASPPSGKIRGLPIVDGDDIAADKGDVDVDSDADDVASAAQ